MDPVRPGPARLLGGRPRGRRRVRRLRLRRRRQPHPSRRGGHRPRRVGRGAPEDRRRPSCSRCSARRSGSARGRPRRCPTTSTWSSRRRAGGRARRCSPRPRDRGIPVWGEVELAWRLRDPDHRTPWLVVTGTNGKTTTTQMLDAILRAEGLRSQAVGNVGLPIVEAVMDPLPYDVLAVELSVLPAALHRLDERRGRRRAQRRRGPPRLVRRRWQAYAEDKARIYEHVQRACVYNVEDPLTEQLVREADVVEGARADRVHPRPAGGRDARRGRRRPGRPGLRGAARVQCRRALHAGRPRRRRRPAAGAAHRAERAGRRGARPRARREPGGGPRRAPVLPAGRPPDRRGRRARRHHLGRRLQGDQPARRPLLAARPTTRSCGSPAGWPRARPSTSWCGPCGSGCAASSSSAGTATWSPRRSRDTRRMCRVIDAGTARLL